MVQILQKFIENQTIQIARFTPATNPSDDPNGNSNMTGDDPTGVPTGVPIRSKLYCCTVDIG